MTDTPSRRANRPLRLARGPRVPDRRRLVRVEPVPAPAHPALPRRRFRYLVPPTVGPHENPRIVRVRPPRPGAVRQLGVSRRVADPLQEPPRRGRHRPVLRHLFRPARRRHPHLEHLHRRPPVRRDPDLYPPRLDPARPTSARPRVRPAPVPPCAAGCPPLSVRRAAALARSPRTVLFGRGPQRPEAAPRPPGFSGGPRPLEDPAGQWRPAAAPRSLRSGRRPLASTYALNSPW